MAELIPDWFPYYVRHYRRDTQHLSTLQHGIYHLLMDHYYENGGLPDDDRKLAAIAMLPLSTWLKHKVVIAPLFHGDGAWRHKRIDAELAKASAKIEKRRAAGSKGGTVSVVRRWQASARANAQANGQAFAQPNAQPNARANGSTSVQANAQDSNSKYITTTSSGAARAREANSPQQVRPPDPAPIHPGDSLAEINRKLGWA